MLPVLHIWPGEWGLLSTHLPSLVAALHLQLTAPGRFSISHCTNPDLSPSGALPFLTHDGQVVTSLSSIIKYISSLEGANKTVDLDAGLTSFEASQKTAWCSHVEAKLGDLASYTLYSLPANWSKLIGMNIAYALPVPQRYYVPSRIRNMHRHRLEAAGLWVDQPAESTRLQFSTTTDHKEQIARAFQRSVQTARDCLDIYARLLGENQFVYHERLTTLDIVLAAHVLVIIKPPFPDRLLTELLVDSYPTLITESPPPLRASPQGYSVWSLLPSLAHKQRREKTEEETQYERVAWGWFTLAAGSVGLFLLSNYNPLALRRSEEEEESVVEVK
ncbi:hypothetical protein B0H14DRAFT_2661291 [Mycena olivaceomarginata]|nr:hypothetical protein B0H14DRAFT_2661291 [Mycena olivaceomarginata]